MRRPQIKRNSPSRNRVLTVTYYIEPRNLRMLTIPVGRLKVGLGVVGMLALWGGIHLGASLVGVFLGNGSAEKSMTASVENAPIENSVPAVEPVSEPKDKGSGGFTQSVGVSKLPEDNVPTSNKAYDYDKALAADVAKIRAEDYSRQLEEDLNLLQSDPPLTEMPDIVDTQESDIRVEAISVSPKADALKIGFNIVNKGKDRAKGRVYGIAEFAANDGKRYLVTSHENVDPSKLSENKRIGNQFSARKLTIKDLNFPLPKNKKGVFTSLRIVVNEDAHSQPITRTKDLRIQF